MLKLIGYNVVKMVAYAVVTKMVMKSISQEKKSTIQSAMLGATYSYVSYKVLTKLDKISMSYIES